METKLFSTHFFSFFFCWKLAARRVEKRKSKDDSPPPSFNGSDSNGSNSGSATNVSTRIIVNHIGSAYLLFDILLFRNADQSDLNVQIPSKKVKTATPCAISPVLLECPEQGLLKNAIKMEWIWLGDWAHSLTI